MFLYFKDASTLDDLAYKIIITVMSMIAHKYKRAITLKIQLQEDNKFNCLEVNT